MTQDPKEQPSGIEGLIQQLAKATGLSDDLAQAVIETAADYVKGKRPDKAEQVDAILADEKTAQRAGKMMSKLAEKTPKPED